MLQRQKEKVLSLLRCQMCGKRFETRRPTRAKFCSEACRSRWWRIEIRWQQWKKTPEGQAYMAMSCDEREALEKQAMKGSTDMSPPKHNENKRPQKNSSKT